MAFRPRIGFRNFARTLRPRPAPSREAHQDTLAAVLRSLLPVACCLLPNPPVNLVLLLETDFVEPARVRLTGRRAAHVRAVHRVRLGDELRVGILNGKIGRGRVIADSGDVVELDVLLERDPPAPLPVILILAMPRPKMFARILQSISSMGVKEIFLIDTWRVERSFWESGKVDPSFTGEQFILGLEQGVDTIMPRLEIRRRFIPFVEDELPAIISGTLPLVAHPLAKAPCPTGLAERVTLAIGPEGGFIANEIEILTSLGFGGIQIGPRILRVETAVPAILGRLFA